MDNLEKLKELTKEIDRLISFRTTPYTDGFRSWRHKSERLLERIYGSRSREVAEFKEIRYVPNIVPMTGYDQVGPCLNGLRKARVYFRDYIEEIEEDNNANNEKKPQIENQDFTKVFIVHGHDEARKLNVARLIEKQGIEVIILNEQANLGSTLIEKFEQHSNVGAAICLFTADDLGHEKNETTERERARQNVVFETGFFMGKIGRNRIVIISDSEIELPSDMGGVVYSNGQSWQFELLKELNAIGYKVDMNKLL